MLKCLRHFYRVGRASLHTQIAHRTQFKMIDKCIQSFFLFAVGCYIKFCNNFYCAVRASQLTRGTTCACMFIVLIVRHHYLTAKPFGQSLLHVRILLRNNFFPMRKIISRPPHAFQQGFRRVKNIGYVISKKQSLKFL